MSVEFVEVDHIDKVYPLKDGGEYVALKNIALKVKEGEFVSLIGHSGCGKSTLLNLIAGFEAATRGGVILEGQLIDSPGPDRMMVFQNYSLLPWLTVRQNIALAVNKVLGDKPKAERDELIDRNIKLVGLAAAADKRPRELSGGMKQRCAIARALSIRPRVLLLDEPFGALDALTRGNLQEQLMEICQQAGITTVMVTHDVDEALLLSDRVVMLTNGPEAHIGRILDVTIPRPRKRLEVVNHPDYYSLRNEMIYFLNQQKKDKRRKAKEAIGAAAPAGIPAARSVNPTIEKKTITLGFMPTTDCATLAVAQAKGLFQKYGFDAVELRRELNWDLVAAGLASGHLDAAQLLAGMPLAMTLGGRSPHICTALVLARNGNAITLNQEFQTRGVYDLAQFKAAIAGSSPDAHVFGVVNQTSMGSLLLRYWLASGGIDPDRDVTLAVMSSLDMQERLSQGTIDGYLAAEPWNNRAVIDRAGFVVATDLELWNGHQNKVLGVRNDWATQYPETHKALMRALMEACDYCDDRRNREEIVELLARPEYLGIDPKYIRPGFIDAYDRGTGAVPEQLTRFNQFHVEQSTCPRRLEALWLMTQLARWGMAPFPKNWVEVLERTYRIDWYGQVARDLGLPDSEPDRVPVKLFDGIVFNPDDPMRYLNSLAIRQPIQVKEISLDDAPRGVA